MILKYKILSIMILVLVVIVMLTAIFVSKMFRSTQKQKSASKNRYKQVTFEDQDDEDYEENYLFHPLEYDLDDDHINELTV